MKPSRFRSRGLTLIELVASLVIISIAVLGLMLTTAGVAGRSSNPMIERQATAIAHAYLEEVMVANFCDPDFLTAGQTCSQQCMGSACSAAACGGVGPLKEASRNLYDDVCDYNGLNDSGAADRNGNGIAGLSLYTVRVTVIDNGISIGSPAISSNSGEVLRIDVSVGHQAMDNDFQLSAFRANAQ